MTQILPASAQEILEAVIELLRETEDPASAGLHRRMAIRLLEVLQREAQFAGEAQQAETQRIRVLLPGAEGQREALNEQLCEAIAAGRMPLNDAALMAHLWATTLDRLAVDQPQYRYQAAP